MKIKNKEYYIDVLIGNKYIMNIAHHIKPDESGEIDKHDVIDLAFSIGRELGFYNDDWKGEEYRDMAYSLAYHFT